MAPDGVLLRLVRLRDSCTSVNFRSRSDPRRVACELNDAGARYGAALGSSWREP